MSNKHNYVVYMHVNKTNNKKYIGISSNVKKRWAGNGINYYDQVFGLAIQKYGWDGFEHIILYDNLTQEQACQYERELIVKYKTMDKAFGYNRSAGGDSGSYGAYDVQLNRMVHVFQYDIDGNFIKEHISIAAAVRELKPGYKGRNSFNIPMCCKGKRLTALGYRWFYEYRGEKIEPIKTPIQRTIEGESRKIYQYTLDGIFVAEFSSISEAKRKTGISSIWLCLNGKTKRAGDYQWFYEYQGEVIAPYCVQNL